MTAILFRPQYVQEWHTICRGLDYNQAIRDTNVTGISHENWRVLKMKSDK